jgi:hypothetical protein
VKFFLGALPVLLFLSRVSAVAQANSTPLTVSFAYLASPATNVTFLSNGATSTFPFSSQTIGAKSDTDSFQLSAVSWEWLELSEISGLHGHLQSPKIQDAGVGGVGGDLAVYDALGKKFAAILSWLNIESTGKDTTASVNVNGDVNVPHFWYSGTKADLLERKSGSSTAGNSGQSRALTPEPGFYGMLSVGLAGLVLLVQKSKSAQKKARP